MKCGKTKLKQQTEKTTRLFTTILRKKYLGNPTAKLNVKVRNTFAIIQIAHRELG